MLQAETEHRRRIAEWQKRRGAAFRTHFGWVLRCFQSEMELKMDDLDMI